MFNNQYLFFFNYDPCWESWQNKFCVKIPMVCISCSPWGITLIGALVVTKLYMVNMFIVSGYK